MKCELCIIAKYCLSEPSTWQFKNEASALQILQIMNHCLESNISFIKQAKAVQNYAASDGLK